MNTRKKIVITFPEIEPEPVGPNGNYDLCGGWVHFWNTTERTGLPLNIYQRCNREPPCWCWPRFRTAACPYWELFPSEISHLYEQAGVVLFHLEKEIAQISKAARAAA